MCVHCGRCVVRRPAPRVITGDVPGRTGRGPRKSLQPGVEWAKIGYGEAVSGRPQDVREEIKLRQPYPFGQSPGDLSQNVLPVSCLRPLLSPELENVIQLLSKVKPLLLLCKLPQQKRISILRHAQRYAVSIQQPVHRKGQQPQHEYAADQQQTPEAPEPTPTLFAPGKQIHHRPVSPSARPIAMAKSSAVSGKGG